MSVYKPLTPQRRNEILDSIDKQLEELKTCEKTEYVEMEWASLMAFKNVVRKLPDGYPIPYKE